MRSWTQNSSDLLCPSINDGRACDRVLVLMDAKENVGHKVYGCMACNAVFQQGPTGGLQILLDVSFSGYTLASLSG
jgi:hypothetical protein